MFFLVESAQEDTGGGTMPATPPVSKLRLPLCADNCTRAMLMVTILMTSSHSTGHPLTVRGVAYSGASGSAIASVEVSVDGGRTWNKANVKYDEVVKNDSSRFHGWVRWDFVADKMPSDFVRGTESTRDES